MAPVYHAGTNHSLLFPNAGDRFNVKPDTKMQSPGNSFLTSTRPSVRPLAGRVFLYHASVMSQREAIPRFQGALLPNIF